MSALEMKARAYQCRRDIEGSEERRWGRSHSIRYSTDIAESGLSTTHKGFRSTYDEQIGHDGLRKIDRGFHDTQRRRHADEVQIRSLICLTLFEGEVQTNNIEDQMLQRNE